MPANTYTPSVNIIRDANRPLVYYPTSNALRVVSQIANDFKQGQRAFNVIGAYGTGKSSLLWALEQSLRATTEPDRKRFFDVNLLPDAAVDVVNVVGEYASIIETIANRFGAEDTQTDHVLQAIYDRYHDLGKQHPTRQPLLVLVVDEFGKFLEYAVKHEPEQELYFVQRLAEFANDTKHNICLVTTVHQNTDAYASALNETQRKEWTKVKGRLREITFNEPVEQLLFLAGEHLANRTEVANRFGEAAPTKAQVKAVLKLAQSSKALSLDKSQAPDIAAKLSPLDPLSASTLALSLQRYGQNERSLFSFLESTDHTSLNRIRLSDENPFYNVANVFDYLIFNFYAYLSVSTTNADYIAWRGIRMTLEKVEGQFGAAAEPYGTKKLKLDPFEAFVGNDPVISYVGIRGDEDREGYISKKTNIQSIFLFRKNIWSEDVVSKVLSNNNAAAVVDLHAAIAPATDLPGSNPRFAEILSKPTSFSFPQAQKLNLLLDTDTRLFNRLVHTYLQQTAYPLAQEPTFPLIDNDEVLVRDDIFRLLRESGVGVPAYYEKLDFSVNGKQGQYAQSRSGCFFCFYQQKIEWIWLYEQHPDRFAEAMTYEKDGYSWNDEETLEQMIQPARIQAIKEEYIKRTQRNAQKTKSPYLLDILGDAEGEGCASCFI